MQADETTFYGTSGKFNSGITSWNVYPTEKNPNSLYKFASLEFTFNSDLTEINRTTYGLLNWLGDCGGLIGFIFSVAELIVSPFASYALTNKLASTILRITNSDRDGSPTSSQK